MSPTRVRRPLLALVALVVALLVGYAVRAVHHHGAGTPGSSGSPSRNASTSASSGASGSPSRAAPTPPVTSRPVPVAPSASGTP